MKTVRWVAKRFTEAIMNCDEVNREINRLVDYYRGLPFDELLVLADQRAVETELTAHDGIVSFVVDVLNSGQGAIRVNVSAFGNNWFKLERIDETVVVSRNAATDA